MIERDNSQFIVTDTEAAALAFFGVTSATHTAVKTNQVGGNGFPVWEVTPKETGQILALKASLQELHDWMREHCGPRDGVHEMLLRSHAALYGS